MGSDNIKPELILRQANSSKNYGLFYRKETTSWKLVLEKCGCHHCLGHLFKKHHTSLALQPLWMGTTRESVVEWAQKMGIKYEEGI